jgi:hypothetical protein
MAANYVLLEKITVGAAGASSVTFSGIPQTGYTDLIVKISPRSDRSGGPWNGMTMTVNGSTSTYSSRTLEGGDSTTASSQGPSTGIGLLNSNGSLYTNTFASTEIYIPNYTSNNFKSFSIESVNESNQTGGVYQNLWAGLWSTTSAITSITLTSNGAGPNFVQFSTFYLYGVAKLGTTPAIVPYATGGDTIMTDGTYWYHAFLSSGTFTPTVGLSADVLTIGGGGGGGSVGGGGGGGGLLYSTSQSLATTGYTVTIGAGGAGSGAATNVAGLKGTNSSFASLVAIGGGGGASDNFDSVSTGGSGGGGCQGFNTNRTNITAGQGNNGGTGANTAPNFGSGGGGGAGAVGSNGTGTAGGNGGAGSNTYSSWLSVIGLGVSGFIAGGGGGGSISGTASTGGSGGGGAGDGASTGTNGTVNTGGGGGGGGFNPTRPASGSGGSGLVIVRYAV